MAPVTRQGKSERLDLRLSVEDKRALEQAAALSGQTISTFVLGASLRRAHEVVEESQVLRLSNQDRERFLAALDRDGPRDIPALRKAFARHRDATR